MSGVYECVNCRHDGGEVLIIGGGWGKIDTSGKMPVRVTTDTGIFWDIEHNVSIQSLVIVCRIELEEDLDTNDFDFL